MPLTVLYNSLSQSQALNNQSSHKITRRWAQIKSVFHFLTWESVLETERELWKTVNGSVKNTFRITYAPSSIFQWSLICCVVLLIIIIIIIILYHYVYCGVRIKCLRWRRGRGKAGAKEHMRWTQIFWSSVQCEQLRRKNLGTRGECVMRVYPNQRQFRGGVATFFLVDDQGNVRFLVERFYC